MDGLAHLISFRDFLRLLCCLLPASFSAFFKPFFSLKRFDFNYVCVWIRACLCRCPPKPEAQDPSELR